MISPIKSLIPILLLSTLVLTLASGCCGSFYDDLSECNEIVLEYRYIPVAEDEYSTYLQGMRHFLFDGDGLFIRELPQVVSSPQQLRITGLAAGKYNVVTVGNNHSEQNTFLSSLTPRRSSYGDFFLHLKKMMDNSRKAYANSEELFWNTKSIEVVANEAKHYICDLANIHCHLIFQVSWQSVPPAAGKYRIELTNLTAEYSLDPTKSPLKIEVNPSKGVVHTFPLHSGPTSQIFQDVKLFNHQLTGEFISLRYRNDRIPYFQVKLGNEEITKRLDLSEAFRYFSWIPDQRAVQIYRIQLRINDDNSVTIRPWYDGSIEDWQPGGIVYQ